MRIIRSATFGTSMTAPKLLFGESRRTALPCVPFAVTSTFVLPIAPVDRDADEVVGRGLDLEVARAEPQLDAAAGDEGLLGDLVLRVNQRRRGKSGAGNDGDGEACLHGAVWPPAVLSSTRAALRMFARP